MANYSYNPQRRYGTHGIAYADMRHSKGKPPKWPIGVLILVILAAIITCGVCYFNDIGPFSRRGRTAGRYIPQNTIRRADFFPEEGENNGKTSDDGRGVIEQTGSLFHDEGTSQNEQTGSLSYDTVPAQVEPPTNTPAGMSNERESALEAQYSKAYLEFTKGNYASAREILRLLCESIGPRDAVYRKATSLLNMASRTMLAAGTDPELSVQYTIVKGDTLSAIAKKFSTTVAAIQKGNGMTNTKLTIGKVLHITRSAWSVEVRRATDELVLLSNGKAFAYYAVYAGTSVPASFNGAYKIVDKNPEPVWKSNGKTYPYGSAGNICGARWIALNPITRTASSRSTALHGSNVAGMPESSPGAPGYFRMSNDDIKEIYDLLPVGTHVNFH